MSIRNFKPNEFFCKCGCGFGSKKGDIDMELPVLLQKIRDYVNEQMHTKPHNEIAIIVNSGCRCPAHNAAVGGTQGSQHLYGRAADIKATKISAKHLHKYILQGYQEGRFPELGGLGSYRTWVHVDTYKVGDRLRQW